MPAYDNVNPGLHVDSDFKDQARREKEQLVEKLEGVAPLQPRADDDENAAAAAGEIPPPSFEIIVEQLMVPALMAMGLIETPDGKKTRDMNIAKFYIDTLAILETKTRGNLTDTEKQMLEMALYEARMQFVNANKQ